MREFLFLMFVTVVILGGAVYIADLILRKLS
jgi:hypothetical protein